MTTLAEEGLEVVHEVGRALLVLEEKEVVSPVALHGLRREEGPGRTDGPVPPSWLRIEGNASTTRPVRASWS